MKNHLQNKFDKRFGNLYNKDHGWLPENGIDKCQDIIHYQSAKNLWRSLPMKRREHMDMTDFRNYVYEPSKYLVINLKSDCKEN